MRDKSTSVVVERAPIVIPPGKYTAPSRGFLVKHAGATGRYLRHGKTNTLEHVEGVDVLAKLTPDVRERVFHSTFAFAEYPRPSSIVLSTKPQQR